jgi:hypothetical protein
MTREKHSMADTQEIKMVGKIVAKTLGNPKKAAGLENVGDTVVLGKIFGMCDGVKQKEDPISGKVYFPLVGRFQAQTAEGAIIRSGVLYFPQGIHETYESAVRQLEEGSTLQFAVELRAVRSTNAAGYSYESVDLMPPSEADPMDVFANKVLADQAKKAKQLGAGADEPTEKGNGKKK